MPEIGKKIYGLGERTVKFWKEVIEFSKKIPKNEITRPIIGQLIRSATSAGASYREANGARSKKDFRNRIFIRRKEIQERSIGSNSAPR